MWICVFSVVLGSSTVTSTDINSSFFCGASDMGQYFRSSLSSKDQPALLVSYKLCT